MPETIMLPPLETEKKPALRPDEALLESNRCLFCHDAPCTRACPTHIDVPRFIKQIASGNLLGSARTILSANILGASCARVCPTEVLCEGACVLDDVQRPIQIGQLQRHATDHAMERGMPVLAPGSPRRPGSVGIIGAGPAGLACAAELLTLGYESIIYEAQEQPGGLNTYGVAQYKMTPAVSLQEVEWLVRSGVQIRRGVRIGRDLTTADLLGRHDALFLGAGMAGVPRLGLPGEDLPGVHDALGLIADLKLGRPLKGLPPPLAALPGRPLLHVRVAVIGGGNTAIDVTTQSARAGAQSVWLVYRRSQGEMSAYPHEQHLSLEHGTRMIFHSVPVRVLGTDRVTGLVIQQVHPQTAVGHTRLSPVPGTEQTLPVDLIVLCTGQSGADVLSHLPTVKNDRGIVQVDEQGRTSDPRIWAGGDCISGGKEVVNAVAEGKRAARGIAREILSAKVN